MRFSSIVVRVTVPLAALALFAGTLFNATGFSGGRW
jgi:hypothetical protein